MDALGKRVFIVTGSFGALVVCGVVGWWFYSLKWSEWKLSSVQNGMQKTRVRAVVGEPARRITNATFEVWSYTRSWSKDANVYFDTNGVVWRVETD